jgi:hypothetical protein
MIADTITAVVDALTAAGLRVAERYGDITPPVCYLQIGTVSTAGGVLAGATVTTLYVYYIPVRGVDNLAGDAGGLDRLFAAVTPLAVADLVATRTSVTVNADTWPCYRADLAVLATETAATLQEV